MNQINEIWRVCTKCEKRLPIKAFDVYRANGYTGIRGVCHTCERARRIAWDIVIEIMTVDHLDVFALRTYLNSLKQRGFTIVSVVPIKGELYAIIESPAPVTPKPGTSQVEPPPTERKVAQIIEVTADKTKNSGSPMWRCLCSDNTRVNIFQHQNPAIDNFEMFKSSGYGSILEAMPVGTTLRFTLQPIQVDLRKDMKWWEIVGVVPCPTEIPEPDPVIPENPPF